MTVSTHVTADPVQAPFHPVKILPVEGAAVSVTIVPLAKRAVHVDPQLIPGGLQDGPQLIPVGADVTTPLAGSDNVTLIAGAHPRYWQISFHSGCPVSSTAAMAILLAEMLLQVEANSTPPE